VWAGSNAGVTVTDASYAHAVPAAEWSCISLGGIDEAGARFTKNVSMAAGHVNVLWFGVQIPLDAQPGAVLSARFRCFACFK
jgi:hypothetical protein